MRDKVVLITGAASGIGRATALAFAKRGAIIVAGDRDEAQGAETVRLIEGLGAKGRFFPCDVTDETQIIGLVQTATSVYGRLDCAFNNAGIEGELASCAETAAKTWDRVLAVNLKGVALCMKHEIAAMLPHGRGAIVNTASIAGLVGVPAISPYVASKHGVVGLTQTAALEFGKKNIRVNAVCPGPILTPMLERLFAVQEDAEKHLLRMTPLARIGKPEEVAEVVVWLCSDAASYVTGVAMPVDGGWTAH